ncbi:MULTISPECIES: hypothetical protein [unclassified Nocardioides]|uniref:hypothetical protein n=1 Tax=unclassified Nocardioides TaxID=2615069 RepID=UPI001055ABD1|nr:MULTISPECIES: hypothetical protein [unclassified Nocardioides]
MDALTLDDLRSPDPRSLRFTSRGLSLDSALSPESALEYHRHLLSSCDLNDQVADATRKAFERIRQLHLRGLFFYDAYTVAYDLCALTLELALRERFMTWHDAEPAVLEHARTQKRVPLVAKKWDDIDASLRKGAHRKGPWGVVTQAGTVPFTGNVKTLLGWARQTGLLPGQRSRAVDGLLHQDRIRAGHISYHLVTPVDSARSIRDLSEIINQLWGSSTPGGRLFPGPLEREVMAIAWTDRALGSITIATRDQLENWEDPDALLCVLVLAVRFDEGLWNYDSWYERTDYPTRLLWGPGPVQDAIEWIRGHSPIADSVDTVDRLFVTRHHSQGVDRPLNLNAVAAISSTDQTGTWTVVRADHPADAFAHALHSRDGVGCGAWSGDVYGATAEFQCAAEEVYIGGYAGLESVLIANGYAPPGPPPVRVQVPELGPTR